MSHNVMASIKKRKHIVILWTGSSGLRYVPVAEFCGYGSKYKYLVFHELIL